jgi:hypothetical protein
MALRHETCPHPIRYLSRASCACAVYHYDLRSIMLEFSELDLHSTDVYNVFHDTRLGVHAPVFPALCSAMRLIGRSRSATKNISSPILPRFCGYGRHMQSCKTSRTENGNACVSVKCQYTGVAKTSGSDKSELDHWPYRKLETITS